ncbi:hypothetical protein CR513_09590, partial [Mucuna pruriens]
MDIPRSLYTVEGMKEETLLVVAQVRYAPEALESQNQDLKEEVNQLKEHIAQMFQGLTQTNVAITTLASQNAARYVQASHTTGPPPCNTRDPPYGMSYGWNIENPTNDVQEQQNAGNNSKTGPQVNANSTARPHDGAASHAQQDSGAQH